MSDLDRIAARAARGPGFDVSPGAISPRPDPELDAAVRERLESEADPFMALVWARGLLAIGTPEAGAALGAYTTRIAREDPWDGGFPGARELLALLGG